MATPDQKKNIAGPLMGLVAVLVCVGAAFYIYHYVYGTQETAEGNVAQAFHDQVVSEFNKPPRSRAYKVKKDMSVLGMGVVRIESRQYPQEFVVLDGMGSDLVDDLFNGNVNAEFVEPLINQVLAMKLPDKKVSMHVEELQTLAADSLQVKEETLPHRRMRIRFLLSTEDEPRLYEGAMVRRKLPVSGQERIVVSFARVRPGTSEKDDNAVAYDPKLMNRFLEAL